MIIFGHYCNHDCERPFDQNLMSNLFNDDDIYQVFAGNKVAMTSTFLAFQQNFPILYTSFDSRMLG